MPQTPHPLLSAVPVLACLTERVSYCFIEVAELVAGYMDCMEEALRYLQEVEEYPEEHPAVQGLRNHLDRSRQKLMDQALMLQA